MITLKFFGGVGDYEHGELGGVQLLITDLQRGKILLDIGQRPDHYSRYFNFPFGPRIYNDLSLLEKLELYPELEGIYRYDHEIYHNHKRGNRNLDGILLTHPHYDHAGGIHLLNPDLPIWMHRIAKQVLFVWQYTSGRTRNQFIDFYDQTTRIPKADIHKKLLSGDEACIPRNIHTFEDGIPFNMAGFKITPYLVDHSVPGSCGFIIETSVGNIGISGDLRWRGCFPKRTDNFLRALKEANLSYLLMEGSLLQVNHKGTEKDVTRIFSELMTNRSLVTFISPPRDCDRLLSLYNAALSQKRTLVINPNMALLLKSLKGEGYTNLTQKYIAVYLPKKRKGTIDSGEEDYIINQDYFEWERQFIVKDWDGPQGKLQRVSDEDIKQNQDQFLVYVPQNQMLNFFDSVKPAPRSRHIDSIPSPWTETMKLQQTEKINILNVNEMYEGPKSDFLNPEFERKTNQVHVTGHFNLEENHRFVQNFNCPIIPYHCMNPQDIKDTASHTKVIIPLRKQEMVLV